ncbi:hypothetical protein VN1274_10210 [Helicobacter pylori]|nr:hypothetical protein VN1274_10210 [Helicobacter pylori]
MINKIIQDTKYHNDFLKKCQTSKDFEEASIEFFLENKDNLKAFPYIFGFRILNYNSNFSLRVVMENHRDECLELIEKWYKSASQYRNENQQDLEEYFWINDYTFSLPLNHTFKQLKIDLPKDFLSILNNLSQNPPKNRKNHQAKPLKPLRKFKILSFRGVFLKNLGFL